MLKYSLLLGIAIGLIPSLLRADSAEATLKKHSPFKTFETAEVADGQILESREGASLSPSVEAVQTCFIIPAPPDVVAARILSWNPAGKEGLEVNKHQILSGAVSPETLEGTLGTFFKSSAGKSAWIADQSKNAKDPSCELLLSAAEKEKLSAASSPAKLASAWATLLADHYKGFREHGASDFQRLRSDVQKLGAGDIPGPANKATYYWEIGDVSDRGTFSEGVSWSDGSGPIRVFDGEFFVTSEYSASLNVSTLWPVSIKGKTVTLVWRIDSAFADQFTDQSGAERIASSGLILASSKKTIEALQHIKK